MPTKAGPTAQERCGTESDEPSPRGSAAYSTALSLESPARGIGGHGTGAHGVSPLGRAGDGLEEQGDRGAHGVPRWAAVEYGLHFHSQHTSMYAWTPHTSVYTHGPRTRACTHGLSTQVCTYGPSTRVYAWTPAHERVRMRPVRLGMERKTGCIYEND